MKHQISNLKRNIIAQILNMDDDQLRQLNDLLIDQIDDIDKSILYTCQNCERKLGKCPGDDICPENNLKECKRRFSKYIQ